MSLTMNDIEEQIKDDPLGKEASRKQFVEMTERLGLKHTFSFEEAWEVAQELRKKKEARAVVTQLEDAIANSGKAYVGEELEKHNPLKHSFADGMYVREVFNEADQIIVTKIHKQKHPFFLMEGEMSVLTENGVVRLKAPHYGITEVGTKRVIYTHTPCKFVTVQRTDKTDIEEIEKEVIAEGFDDPVLNESDIERLMEVVS